MVGELKPTVVKSLARNYAAGKLWSKDSPQVSLFQVRALTTTLSSNLLLKRKLSL